MTAQDQATRSVFSPEISGRIEDGVLVVTIDNPPVNAASATMRAGLFAAVRHADASDEIRATVITGAGRNFVGGADIREFGAPMAGPALPELIALIEASDKPFVAAINGAALGGGLELALACHHRIAVTEAKLGLPEVKLGIVPGAGGTQRLPRLVGTAVAVEMIATGRIVAAAEALSLGIVDRVVPMAWSPRRLPWRENSPAVPCDAPANLPSLPQRPTPSTRRPRRRCRGRADRKRPAKRSGWCAAPVSAR